MSSLPAKKIRFGILGASRVAVKNFLPALQKAEFAELAMVGSRTPEKAKSVAGQFDCKSWGSYDEVLADKHIDAVYISLPNAMHEEWTVKSTDAGKHVICEKPAAISYAAAKNMTEAAKRNNVRILEGFMFRYHPQHAKVKDLIKNGVLGNCLRFDGIFGYPAPSAENIRMKPELGGGSFYDAMPYPVYGSRMIFEEEPESVFCKIENGGESGVDKKSDIFMSYPGGKTAFMSSIFGSYFQSTYSVLGSKALVRVERAYAVPREMSTKIFLDADDKTQEYEIKPADHFRLMVDDFCREVSSGSRSRKFEEDLLAQARVLEAAKLSDNEKRVVRIDEID